MIKILSFLSAIVLLGLPHFLWSSDDSTRMVVHLLDYVAEDYGGAVQNGKVVSEGEYKEQLEFISEAAKSLQEYSGTNRTEVNQAMNKLKSLVETKASSGEVSALAKQVRVLILDSGALTMAPKDWPSLMSGAKLYSKHCASCHGDTGRGDGRLAKRLDPKPANFLDAERMNPKSPFQEFNTIQLGVPGTGMTSYKYLGEQEVWSLAFYVMSLRHKSDEANTGASLDGYLEKVSQLSDISLIEVLPGNTQQKQALLKRIRIYQTQKTDVAAANPLDLTRSLLNTSKESFEKKDFEKAKQAAMMAYLDGFEKIEGKLRAADEDLTSTIEGEMGVYRSVIEKRADVSELTKQHEVIFGLLQKAEIKLTNTSGMTWFAFLGAFSVILREGFEALLIVIALLGVVRGFGSAKGEKWIHGGWIAAVGVGFVTWFFANWLMDKSGAGVETLEGITSLVAVVILLYMGFWLHSKSEIRKWNQYIQSKISKAVENKNVLGLGALSFLAVFREAVETVLFLKALWLESGTAAKSALLAGLGAGFGCLIGVAYLMLKFSARMPIQKIFQISSFIMIILSVVLVGKGIHALQVTGLLSETALPYLGQLKVVGFFPTFESAGAQLAVILLTLLAWLYTNNSSRSGMMTA